jgi:histidyl-tRNA synthetase
MQKGRGRSFSQFNADIFGEPGPEAEIELVALLVQCLCAFGLTEEDFLVRLSDRNLWFHYLEALGFDGERARALLSAVDKHERMGDDAFRPYEEAHGALDPSVRDRVLAFSGIKSMDTLREAVGRTADPAGKLASRLADWERLLDGLHAMGLARFVSVDLGVVRGLAYYTGFVFEAFDRKGELRSVAGGGRYDDLVEKLGGPALPAAGFAIGDMTFALLLEQRGLAPAPGSAPDVYCVIGGAAERRAAFGDIHALRASGFRVDYPFRDAAFGKQFKAAAESGARLALIYGADELAKGVVKFRDMTERSEHEVPRGDVAAGVRDFFSAEKPGR